MSHRTLGLVAALALSTALAPSASAAISTKGMNIGWLQDVSGMYYGGDLTNAYNGGTWGTWIGHAKAGRVSVVRIWLHENAEGITWNGSVPTGTTTQFQNNMKDLATRLKSAGVSVEWVLLNAASQNSTQNTQVRNCYNNRGNFNSTVYAQDKNSAKGTSGSNGASIKRWDLANEINYVLSASEANTFKSACSGTGYSTDNTGYTGASQFHRYSDDTYPLSNAGIANNSFGKVLGEFGPSWNNRGNATYMTNAINNFWNDAWGKGFVEASPWKIQDTDGFYYRSKDGSWTPSWATTWNNK